MDKTNVMRTLDARKINYTPHIYDKEIVDGVGVANILNQPIEKVFKTLVTVGNNLLHYVFVVPVAETLDLKKAAKVVNVKNIEMIKQKELLPLTGYLHGGCSPIGMKKQFKTIIDEAAILQETFCISAGKVGNQVELSPNDLVGLIECEFSDITVK